VGKIPNSCMSDECHYDIRCTFKFTQHNVIHRFKLVYAMLRILLSLAKY
jgi:hypothetical protein